MAALSSACAASKTLLGCDGVRHDLTHVAHEDTFDLGEVGGRWHRLDVFQAAEEALGVRREAVEDFVLGGAAARGQ